MLPLIRRAATVPWRGAGAAAFSGHAAQFPTALVDRFRSLVAEMRSIRGGAHAAAGAISEAELSKPVEALAEGRSAPALCELGMSLVLGHALAPPRDPVKGAALLRIAWERDRLPFAALGLASCLHHGVGVPADPSGARAVIKALQARGSTLGAFGAAMLTLGSGKRNSSALSSAYQQLVACGKQGVSEAWTAAACMAMQGQGTTASVAEVRAATHGRSVHYGARSRHVAHRVWRCSSRRLRNPSRVQLTHWDCGTGKVCSACTRTRTCAHAHARS